LTIANLTVTNSGNIACDVEIRSQSPDGLSIGLEGETLAGMSVGETRQVTFTLESSDLRGLHSVIFSGNAIPLTGESIQSGNDSATLEVMISGDGQSDGIAGLLESLGLPPWSIAVLALVIVALLGLVILRLSRTDSAISRGEELLSPGEILGAQENRREAALNIGVLADNQTSGAVSADELAAALSQSQPKLSLPPLPGGGNSLPAGLPPTPTELPMGLPPASIQSGPPLPAGGLPSGWTMEQWKHYGQEYLERTGQV
ncbi:MAG: hypothetical protein P8Q90_04420, partial [Candidatus Thalassarchaeaceae archaeon]|nr:hypothetical protein [Candidatus Thalassarchaeaceae archaeon]